MEKLSLLEQVQVNSPCHASWEDMSGNDQVRFCNQCRKNVFNFSAMTRVEGETLLRTKGNLCGRFTRGADGRVLTRETAARRTSRNWFNRVYLALASVVLFIVSGCSSPRTITGKMRAPEPPPSGLTNQPPVLMGDVAAPVPPQMGIISHDQSQTNQ